MNFNAICRTCLTCDNLNPIFVRSVDHESYSTAILVTTGIKVDIDDGLPQQMCARCIIFSKASLKFRKQCKDAETRLFQMVHEFHGAADTLNNGAVDNGTANEWDVQIELKVEVDSKSDTDCEVEDNESGALNTAEQAPLQLKPAGGAGAAPERARARPGEGLAHNVKPGAEKALPYSSDDTKSANDDVISYSDNVSNIQSENQSDSPVPTVGSPGPHICDVCAKEFTEKRHLVRHKRRLHVDDSEMMTHKFVCDICTKRFKYLSWLRAHMKVHTRQMFSCVVCDKQFSRESCLGYHMKVHMDKRYICDVCKKEFNKKSKLINHIRVHTKEYPFSCDVCKKRFMLKVYLKSHRRVHTGEKPYSCSVCNKQFSHKSNLTGHMRKHTGVYVHSCGVCKKEFALKYDLTTHLRIHTGEKPFACDVCKRQFSQKNSLISHSRIHTGVKPFCCDFCGKKFTQKPHLINHIRTHTGERPFACEICGKKFAQQRNYNSHLNYVHGRRKKNGQVRVGLAYEGLRTGSPLD